MFTLGDLIQICIIVFASGGIIASTRKDVKFLKNRIEYWFGTGNVDGKDDPDKNEGIGIIKLKKYMQHELTLMDKRYEERFKYLENEINALKKITGLVKKIQKQNGNNNKK